MIFMLDYDYISSMSGRIYNVFPVAALFGVPTEKEREEIAQKVKHKWRLFGLQLGIDGRYLDEISKDYGSNDALCSSELFRRWANRELPGDRPFTWRGVIEILDGSLIRETTLARKLEERIKNRLLQ